jgi:hypothetical protein
MEENYKKILLDIINNGEIIDEFNHLETNILSIYNYSMLSIYYKTMAIVFKFAGKQKWMKNY